MFRLTNISKGSLRFTTSHVSSKFCCILFEFNITPIFSRSSQCSTTDVTKAVVCVILSVGWCI